MKKKIILMYLPNIYLLELFNIPPYYVVFYVLYIVLFHIDLSIIENNKTIKTKPRRFI